MEILQPYGWLVVLLGFLGRELAIQVARRRNGIRATQTVEDLLQQGRAEPQRLPISSLTAFVAVILEKSITIEQGTREQKGILIEIRDLLVKR